MLVKKFFYEKHPGGRLRTFEGWYLFGFIPLYVREI